MSHSERKEDDIMMSDIQHNKPRVMGHTAPITQANNNNTSRSDVDDALLFFSRTFISERRPRSTSGDVTKQGAVIVTKLTDTLDHCFSMMASETVLGVAVIDSEDNNKCVGVIDTLSIARYIYSAVIPQFCNYQENCKVNLNCNSAVGCTKQTTTNGSSPATGASVPCLTAEQINSQCSTEIWDKIKSCIVSTTVKTVVDWEQTHHCCPITHMSSCSPASSTSITSACTLNTCTDTCNKPCSHANAFCRSLIIPEGFNLLFAMQLMANPGVRRLVVVNREQQVVGYYSQSMVISDVRQNSHLLKAFTARPVTTCLKKDKPVVSLPITATTFEAFLLMIQHQITGIALLDGNSKLTGTLSLRDLRGCGLHFEHISRLALPIKDFKQIVLQEFKQLAPPSHWSSSSLVPQGARYITVEEGTIRDVLLSFNDGLLRRCFVMDANSNLRGVVTLSDVIQLLLETLGVLDRCCGEECDDADVDENDMINDELSPQ